VVEGRAPRGPTELLLGTRTLRALGAHLGSEVTVTLADRTTTMTIVGRGVVPEFASAARLGDGAMLTLAGMRSVAPDTPTNIVLVRVAPGAAGRELLHQIVEARVGNVYLPAQPSDLADLDRVGGTPSIAAALLAILALATLAHVLLISVRRQRRELAILKVLGFRRSDIFQTVAWQATAISLVTLALGLPVGIAAGTWAWRSFADHLGVPGDTATPALAWTLMVLAALTLSNATAAAPARLAARTRPVDALRLE
jgi:putative ABC transport system permease protein